MAQSINTTLSPNLLNSSLFKQQQQGLMSLPTTKTTTSMYGSQPATLASKPLQNTSTQPTQWGIPQLNLNTYNLPNMDTKTSTPAIGNITPTAPKTTPAPTTGGTQPVPTTQTPKPDSGMAYQTPSPATTPAPVKGLVEPPATSKDKKEESYYKNLLDALRKASDGSKQQADILQELRDVAARNTELGENASAISKKYADEIDRVGKLGAGAMAHHLSTGTNVVGSGNAAIASQSASQRMSALSEAQQAELAGNTQQLTASEQYASGLQNALAGANTQQQLQISGLGSAAGYAQPSPAGYGQTVFDPTTGQYTGSQGNLDPQTAAAQLAEAVRSGRMTYEQAVSSLGYSGAGQQFLNNALGPDFNPTLSSATAAGQAGVIGQLPAMEAADVAAEGIKGKITTYLAGNPQLNPSDLAVGNTLQQWIQGTQLTDPKYQTLFNYLNEYTSTLAPILGVGGDPTNLKTQIAQSFINAAASGQSIAEVLDNMQTLSRGKIADIRSGATGGGVVSSPVTGSGTGSGGLYDW